MISGKIIFFSICLHSRKIHKTKQQKKPTPKTTRIHQKWKPPLPATATHPKTHPATHPNPNKNP